MPTHKVTVTFDVPYYGDVEVQAETPHEARLKVCQALSKGDEIAHPLFNGIKMKPDMFQVGQLTVVERIEMPPPAPTKTNKQRTRPTFKDHG